MRAHPLYGAFSQQGLLDPIKPAYNRSWPGGQLIFTASAFNQLCISMPAAIFSACQLNSTLIVVSACFFCCLMTFWCVYPYRVTSAASAFIGGLEVPRRKQIVIWPEWNEADISSEKWV